MTVTLTHRSGAMTEHVHDADLRGRAADLDERGDSEHPDVSVTHESGWSLSTFPSGRLVWENVEADTAVRHRAAHDRDEVLRLFRLLARDDVDAVASSGWESDYGG